MSGPLSFLFKKGFHPQKYQNVQKVWEAEEKKKAEEQKLFELQKTLQAEREREALEREYAKAQGRAPRQERVDWMYEGMGSLGPSKDDYLLGRARIGDEPAPVPELEEEAPPPTSEEVAVRPHHGFSVRVEDPMFSVMATEQRTMAEALSDPLELERLREALLRERMSARAKSDDGARRDECEVAGSRRRSRHRHRSSRYDDEADDSRSRHRHRSSRYDDEADDSRSRHRHRSSRYDDEADDSRGRHRHRRYTSEEEGKKHRGRSDARSQDAPRDEDRAPLTWGGEDRTASCPPERKWGAPSPVPAGHEDDGRSPARPSPSEALLAAPAEPVPPSRPGYGLQLPASKSTSGEASIGPSAHMQQSRMGTLESMKERGGRDSKTAQTWVGRVAKPVAELREAAASPMSLEEMARAGDALAANRARLARATLVRNRQTDQTEQSALHGSDSLGGARAVHASLRGQGRDVA
jgi:hypothetical protein